MSCGGEGSRNRRATRPASWTSPAFGPRCWVLHGAGGGERGEIELARLPPGAEIAKDVTATGDDFPDGDLDQGDLLRRDRHPVACPPRAMNPPHPWTLGPRAVVARVGHVRRASARPVPGDAPLSSGTGAGVVPGFSSSSRRFLHIATAQPHRSRTIAGASTCGRTLDWQSRRGGGRFTRDARR
jgi:hypothetical protein